ncbi:MAG: SDR family NAD(P)-dependent oxidoreductase [Novosphingobium sp.]|nr:SDR family NAD(P)-dependent oxidoreductase [Novosphingobium sp.]
MKIETGQVAVVTGAGSGIGRGLAIRFGELGLRLVLADVDEAGLRHTEELLEGSGVEVVAHRTDVSDAAAMEGLRDLVLARFGGVDILCNNAGIVSAFRPMWENPLNDWQRVLGANLWGVIHGIRLFVPEMVARGCGHVVNTASMAGLIVVPSNGVYNATKHAVVSLSETLRADLEAAGHSIGVTVVCPGMVSTNINKTPDLQATRPPLPADVVYLEPSEIARQVAIAIERNQLYLATNPGSHERIEARVDRVLRETAAPL